MVEELPPETLERLVRRPEDLSSKVTENIRKYKTNMLRLLEVIKKVIMIFYSLPQVFYYIVYSLIM